MALLGDNAAKNQKSRKSQGDLHIEARPTGVGAEGPKADGVKGVAEGHTGEVKEDGPRPDGAEFDGLVMHGNTENKKECSQHDGQLLRADLAEAKGDGGEVEREADREDKPEVFL